MTREQKISLIVGFTLVLLVGVAVSDHLSAARSAQLESGLTPRGDMDAFDEVQNPIPESKPMETFAAAPEYSPTVNTPTGPIAKSLEDAANPPADFLTKLRNRIQDFPLAADTITRSDEPIQTQSIFPPPKRSLELSTDEIAWHPVVEGDTLWSIAEQYYNDGALAVKLATFNGANPELIRPGVRLRIPAREALTGEAAPKSTPSAPKAASNPTPKTETKPVATRNYTVKKGDTLGAIAQRELGTVKRINEILKLNPKMSDADDIRVDDVIKLPSK